jgi:hypothetical protein
VGQAADQANSLRAGNDGRARTMQAIITRAGTV